MDRDIKRNVFEDILVTWKSNLACGNGDEPRNEPENEPKNEPENELEDEPKDGLEDYKPYELDEEYEREPAEIEMK